MHTEYDQYPTILLPPDMQIYDSKSAWGLIAAAAKGRSDQPIVVIDCYPGVNVSELIDAVSEEFTGWQIIDVEARAARSDVDRNALIARSLTSDRVFGIITHFDVKDFYNSEELLAISDQVRTSAAPTLLVGWGAALIELVDAVVVLADMARWEIQRRQRAGAPNWLAGNAKDDPLRKFKRGYFIEWRMADRHKRTLFDTLDFLLDTNRGVDDLKLISGDGFRSGLEAAAHRPFRVVPFFDPGVWGGQWMKKRLHLDPAPANYAWGFDCVPEENSLLFEAHGVVIEVPSIDLVLWQPRNLLGDKTFARFGAEFPIRFDFLDTMGGGNLSLQVHPLTEYIKDQFGMPYTQDESYYFLDCEDDAAVYLGMKTGAHPGEMIRDLQEAATGGIPFPVDRYVNSFPARKHDHFSIPAGTVHCSGANSMVLEISATPYIFTFKLWDWGRVGLDGVPRPIHLDHGVANIQWDRDTEWVERELLGQVEVLSTSGGVIEERTGLHGLEFIETKRRWFSDSAPHDTCGTVNVLNLVDGDEVEVVSPTGAFEPFVVHYAETFIVPASVGPYLVRRTSNSTSNRFATIEASVRGTRMG